ncbi:NUDIX hydrolase [Macrococcus animalis]|uniref:NUDIX hydrolase n=1 Tax=Macrococcus animalis TaxID=3395467 RepID=UPI0039BE7170
MKKWNGASIIVIRDNKLLIVKSKSEQKWSIPTGGLEGNEIAEEAAVREAFEETGYRISVINHIDTTSKVVKDYEVTVDYFLGEVISGEILVNDPDEEIEEVKWISKNEMSSIEWLYPEDITLINKYQ